ncbi:MAG: insulinase family protein [Rhodobacteraceae bacterium]|jgi:zinc protease|uniref:M16 family metallopeptidase n=1 Tax=Albidovulum sp. TaxID=1872424 RepID=UPI001D417E86|nr:pitrilysin family protein [uncultured Defluviimonas sp.]MCB2126587.1 insulinase family protein [Paracoccaceae bacterium]MCC0071211.1 insulinase family protein [Paracoccaceae bacterium]
MIRTLRWLAVAAFSTPAFGGEVSTFVLENGLEAVVIEDHRAPVVVQMVWYKAGAADEKRGVSGVAHFLEHLMFKGTDTVPSGAFSKTVEANGGSDNAFTSWDFTAYFQRVAADRLELVMKMEADRMRHLKLTEDDWRTEREVIIEERNQRTDSDPGAIFGEQRRAAQFLNHPYGTPVIGWRHEMEALTRENALDWYRTNYAPNNAVLVVAGDVDPAEVKRLAQTYYGPLEPTPGIGPRARPQEPPQLAERRMSFADPRVAQPFVSRSYLAPERDPGDQKSAAALTILAELLGGSSQTSLFARKLQFETKQAIYTNASYDGTSYDDTIFGLAVVPAEGVGLAEAEAAMDGVIADFLKNGVDADQFARVKTRMKAAMVYAEDDIDGLARRYGEALTTGLTVADVEDWPDVLAAVTEDDVLAAARQVFDRRRAVTGWLMREGTGEVMQ